MGGLISDIFQDFIYHFFRERGREGERQGENINAQKIHQSAASYTPPAGDLASNPGMRPDWEITGKLSSQAGVQSTEPHQPG